MRNNFSVIGTADGHLAWYKTTSKAHSKISRAKNFVVGCHIMAQEKQLAKFLHGKGSPCHVIISRIMDDTNVWVQPQRQGEECEDDDDENDQETECEHKRKRPGKSITKVAPVLGFIQKICARRPGSGPEFLQLHVPTQVLPKVPELLLFLFHELIQEI